MICGAAALMAARLFVATGPDIVVALVARCFFDSMINQMPVSANIGLQPAAART